MYVKFWELSLHDWEYWKFRGSVGHEVLKNDTNTPFSLQELHQNLEVSAQNDPKKEVTSKKFSIMVEKRGAYVRKFV